MGGIGNMIKGIFSGGGVLKEIKEIADEFIDTKGEKADRAIKTQELALEVQKLMLEKADKAAEQANKELELRLKDVDSARRREVERAKALGKEDQMMKISGMTAMFLFVVILVSAVFAPALGIESNKEIIFHVLGVMEGIALTIFGYYYGNARKEKSEKLEKEEFQAE